MILSCHTGEGHNMAGKAIAEAAEARGHEAVQMDIMMLSGRTTSRMVGGAYVKIVQHIPAFFRFLYWIGGVISSPKRKSPVYYANALLAKPLARFLEENPFDAIVTCHLYAAETLTYMKKKGMLSQKFISVQTDYTCIPFWEETECDYYVIPHPDLAEEYASRGIPREKLLPYGIPVRRMFRGTLNRELARQRCNLPPEKPVFLVMSGSMGFGKIQLFVPELAKSCKAGEQIVIICGNNRRLERLLRRLYHSNPNIHVRGFVRRVGEYMDACDVLFTKPGGLTSTEAAVKNIPIVHTSPIPGCEERNQEFFSSRRMSIAARGLREQIQAGQWILTEDGLKERMRQAQRENVRPRAADEIVTLLARLSAEEKG